MTLGHDDDSAPAGELAGALRAVAPDVTNGQDDRLRKALVRRRLLGGGLPAIKLGRFTVLGQVGSGAMSVVYAAYDEELDRRVAVKVLRAPVTASLGDQRLRREAQAMARLSHPNVAAVHEIGSWHGRMFIAMEFIKGETLEAWLRADRRGWQQILEVFVEAGRGLAAVHALGLVHRDFKPTNVMIGDDGRTRVLDFGLVRRHEEAGPPDDARGEPQHRDPPAPALGPTLTATGDCLGTLAYMAPEQRVQAATADARSDQFSFCVALHEAVFGVRPIADTPTARSTRIPARLAAVIDRGLAADPRARWTSMEHLLGELTKLRWPARRWRPHRAVLAMAALIATVVVVAHHLVAREQRATAALEQQAAYQRARVHDAKLVIAAQQLAERDPTAAAAALREVEHPDDASGWRSTATATLFAPLSTALARDLDRDCGRVEYSPDAGRVLVSVDGGGMLVRRADNLAALATAHDHERILALSSDHRWVLAQAADATIVLARTDGQIRRTVSGLGEAVSYAIVPGPEPDIVAVSPAGRVRRWRSGDSQSLGAPPPDLARRDLAGWGLQIGPAGRHVITSGPAGELWRWQVGSTQPAVRLAPPGPPRRVWFSDDERWIAVASETGEVALWDTRSARSPVLLRGHEKRIFASEFSADGRWLATASYDGTARVWPTQGAASPVVLRGHTSVVTSVRFDRDARRAVTASYDRTARVWNLDGSGGVMVLRGHTHQLLAATFSPDGQQVVTCGLDPAVRLWNVSLPPVRVIGRHAAEIWSASLDPDGARLVTAAFDGTATIWQLDGSRPGIVLRGHEGHQVYAAMFSPDGTRVATGANDGTARIWRADGSGAPRILPGHVGWVYGLAFSPDGRWLATGSSKGEVRLSPVDGDGAPRSLVSDCAGPESGWVESLIFGPSGDWLATTGYGCQRGAAVLPTQVQPAPSTPSTLGALRVGAVIAVNRDGLIATAERDGLLRVWRAAGAASIAAPIATLRSHGPATHDLSFSRDGKRLLSASFDGTAQIWDLEHPVDPVILRGHEDWVVKGGFDSTGTRVVTASYDGTARVWQLDDPRQPIILRGHEGKLRYAGFTPDGRVVTASFDGTVRLWSLDRVAADNPALSEQLRKATTVCLPAHQRMQYLDETLVVAGERFAACERAAGRAPS